MLHKTLQGYQRYAVNPHKPYKKRRAAEMRAKSTNKKSNSGGFEVFM